LEAWREAAFGLFIHWGIYSIPAGIWKGERIQRLGEQIQRHAAIPQDEYAALASQFNPVAFDARGVARLAKQAGMTYIVITAKHHDGFCMFKSDYTNFNIVDATPYGKDILAQLAEACAEEELKLGVYYSNPDWHFAGAVSRSPANHYAVFEPFTPEHLDYSCNQLRELLTNYGPIFEVFFDMGLPTTEESVLLAQTVHECQPDCLVSGRVMNNQGDFLTLPDNHIPGNPIAQAWETPCTFYHTWGYKSWIERPPEDEQLARQIGLLQQVIGRGGNYLLNIGPLPDGSILPYERTMLERIGVWMNDNGHALLDSRGAPHPPPPAVAGGDSIVLDGQAGQTEGFYNSLQYNTNVPDVRMSWEMADILPGQYDVTVSYELRGDPMPVLVRLGDTVLEAELAATTSGAHGEAFSDGNEIEAESTETGTSRVTVLGTVTLKTLDRVTIALEKNAARVDEDGVWTEADITSPHQGPWCLNDTWTAHRRAVARYSLARLTVHSIDLTPKETQT